ncbi:beta strand repeat-containing protein [Serratia sp. NFX21]|uniref:beta strand repeat-containing protein n=1 Tax=Serratia sp. NFX21 TaxID=3402279 RepID=UPI003AF40599
MASLELHQKSVALLYAVLGQKTTPAVFDLVAASIERGEVSFTDYVQSLLSGSSGITLYGGQTDSQILSTIYSNVHGEGPSTAILNSYLGNGLSLSQNLVSIINGLLDYNGFDTAELGDQTTFINTVNTILYPSNGTASNGSGASDVLALTYVLGLKATVPNITSFGEALNNGTKTLLQVAAKYYNDRPTLVKATDSVFVSSVFKAGFLRDPTTAELNSYLSELTGGASRPQVIIDIINSLRDTVGSGDTAAQAMFDARTKAYAPGELPELSLQEQVATVYLAVASRGIDAVGLDGYTKPLAAGIIDNSGLITRLLGSEEFQRKGAQLTGDDFIQHVYTNVHGAAASAAQLAIYAALGSNKTAITQAIINDLRTSTATDATTVTQQHGFEFDIGTSLLYKTAASLTTTAAGGNATGTVNTGASHQISNAETAVLTDVQLAANAASVVNLKFADHLANLTINGTSAATVNLSDNGVNPGVDITVNNGNVILNASSGADDVLVTTTAAVATATGDFNLGAGNDSLKWLGNAAVGGANTVGAGISGNGGDGIDTISANFITKNVVMSGNAIVRTATITSNASQFTNFEKIDLAGYIGKATVNTGSTAANHTFDFGLLTGNAVSESSTTGLTNNVVQAATSNIGSQGFVLSGLAEAVKVINAAGGNSAQLEVTGNATAASSVEITFLQNATNHFNVTFDAVSSTDVNAGSLALNSSSSLLLPTALSTLNIASGGTGSFDNILSLTGTNAQVQNIAVTGDHLLDLTVGSGFSNVRDINASANTGGLDLNSNHAGTGDGIIVQLLNILPLSAVTTGLLAPVLTALGLNGYQLTVEGTGTTDSFNVLGNTTLAGGNGVNTYELKSSTTQAGVTITDFDSAKDKIVDAASALTISGDTSGTAVADYGTRASDTLDALLGTLVGGLTNGVIGLLGGILGLGSSNALTAKVGVASVVFGGSGDNASSYVIIDNNDNHTLDTNDSVVYLTGQNHQQLLDTLHYA